MTGESTAASGAADGAAVVALCAWAVYRTWAHLGACRLAGDLSGRVLDDSASGAL